MITENLPVLKIHKLTQAQYDRELASGNLDENALYLTPDEEIDLNAYVTIEELNTKTSDVLRFSKQTLTDAQKAQVIENLGLADFIQSMIQQQLDTTIAEEASW